eukprot:g19791.t1
MVSNKMAKETVPPAAKPGSKPARSTRLLHRQTWDAPPPAPSSSAALAPPALPWPVQAPSPLLDLQPPASIAPSARFQVYSEDCEEFLQLASLPVLLQAI